MLSSKLHDKKINKFREQYGERRNTATSNQVKVTEKEKLKNVDHSVLYVVLMLLSIGLIMVFSASSYYSLYTEGDAYYFLTKEVIWVLVGLVGMIVTINIDYHIYKKMVWYIYGATIILLIAVFFFPHINGANRWILIGGQSFQPSEFAKYSIVVFLAHQFEKNESELKDFIKGPCKYLALAIIPIALIYKQPNMSISVILGMVTCVMLYLAKTKFIHMLFFVVSAVLGVFSLIFMADYRISRWTSFLNPWNDPSGESFQLIQSFLALGSGGLLGKGLGASTQKALYMPEPHNDFIFSIIGEEFGFIGCITVLLLFVFLILRGFSIASKARDKFGYFIAAGITLVIGFQAMINMAVVVGAMPVTGVPLPFISYGGSSLVINLAAIGILLNISRQRNK